MFKNLFKKNNNKLKFYILTLLNYKKKIIQVIFFEFYYTFIFKDSFYKIINNPKSTDSMPSVYYFVYKISQFVKKNPIKKIFDLGSGTGRLVNFLASSTKAKVFGYELDDEVISYARKKKFKNAYFYKKNINSLNFKKLHADCYVVNDPFKDEKKFVNLIKKIELSKKRKKKKYFIITINIDGRIKKNNIKNIFKNFILVLHIQPGKTKSLRIFESKI